MQGAKEKYEKLKSETLAMLLSRYPKGDGNAACFSKWNRRFAKPSLYPCFCFSHTLGLYYTDHTSS